MGDSKLPVYYSEVLFHLSCTQSATKYENKSLKYSSFFFGVMAMVMMVHSLTEQSGQKGRGLRGVA